jgi:hypothetical protein
VLLRQGDRTERREQKLPCSLKIEIQTPRGVITAPVYEISIDGILVSGPDAERLAQGQSFDAVLGAVPHQDYVKLDRTRLIGLLQPGGLLADLKGLWRGVRLPDGIRRWVL